MNRALTSLTQAERELALQRYQLLRPFLEESVALTQVARHHQLPLRTLRRWARQYRADGLAGLVRKRRSDAGTHNSLTPELQECVEGLALQRPPLSAAAIHRQVSVLARDRGEAPPSYPVVYRIVRALPPAITTLAHEGTKAYAQRFDLICRREAEGPNALWQADHCQLDLYLVREGQEPAKPWLTVIQDDYTRAIAGYFLGFEAPAALRTALALRQAIWRKDDPRWHVCGIPAVLYTDNGSDFTSHHVEQVCADLKIRLVFSLPGQPRGRGRIERFFETVQQELLSPLPGYAPPSGGIRGAEQLTLSELEGRFREFLLADYHVRVHRETGVPPQERWDAGGFLPQMPETLEQLDLLLLTVPQARKVHPDGIHFQGHRYQDPVLAAYVGEAVILRYDPRDLAEVRVFHANRFLCRAICPELAGTTLSLREILQARNRRRRELRQTLQERQHTVDTLLGMRRGPAEVQPSRTRSQSRPRQNQLRQRRSSSAISMSSSSPAFVVTREHQRFAEFCDACRSYRYIGLCHGTPGVGKTLSARHYARWDQMETCRAMYELPDTELAAMQGCETAFYTPRGVHSPGQIEHDLQELRVRLREIRWEKLRREETQRLGELREQDGERRQAHLLDHDWLRGALPAEAGSSERNYARVIREYADRREEHSDPTRLIVIDEADRLKVAALEQVRDHFDRSQVGVVLIGMPGLEKRLARYPQLYSRVGFVHEYRRLSPEAVRALLREGWRPPDVTLPDAGWQDEEVLAVICRVTGGNFRLLHRLLAQMARLATINQLSTVTVPLVEAARESLVVGDV